MSAQAGSARVEGRSEILRRFGCALRALRVERGYGQEGFAKHAAIDRSYYGAIERGEFNVSLGTLMRLAAGLEVSASEILRRAEL
jgi:transcriptional regulator with XRE-family HTH domain